MTPTKAGEFCGDLWSATFTVSLLGYLVTRGILNGEEFDQEKFHEEIVSKETCEKVNKGCLKSIKIHFGIVGLMMATLAGLHASLAISHRRS